jgi:hypothetical protein
VPVRELQVQVGRPLGQQMGGVPGIKTQQLVAQQTSPMSVWQQLVQQVPLQQT